MHRRNVTRVLGATIVLGITGCTGVLDEPGSGSPSTEETDTPHSPSEGQTTPYSRRTPRLSVVADVEEGIYRLRLTADSTGDVVYDAEHDVQDGPFPDLNDYLEVGEDYRLSISHGGEEIFTRPVYDYEIVEITIRSETEVEETYLEEI